MSSKKGVNSKITRRPRININKSSKEKVLEYIKQLITLLSLQQAVTRNLEKEINS